MKTLVLLGGGHAHVKVLADFGSRRPAGWAVHLVSPYRRQIYSGMLPGWIAGHYPLESCAIALDTLAERAGVVFHPTAGVALDAQRRHLHCADGSRLDFDLMSIDTGPMAALDALPGALANALPIRPIEAFVAAWPDLAARMCGRRFELSVLGAGAAGLELAFAIHHRARREGGSGLAISLSGSGALPLEGHPAGLRRRASRLLEERGIAWHGGRRALRIEPGRIEFESGPALAFDACLVATGAAAPGWARASGLQTDDAGFIRVGPSLQSLSHPQILAAGDVAAYSLPRPKSGVYAVKAGPVLAHNLRALCEGREPHAWKPQALALYLLSTGGRHALASWGPLHFGGDWVWRWKDRIDRRFIARFAAAA